jgi:hypothetical protein
MVEKRSHVCRNNDINGSFALNTMSEKNNGNLLHNQLQDTPNAIDKEFSPLESIF